MRSYITPCTVLASIWIKWAIGAGGYSGRDSPPMFGDYEAQRHWMEITRHLPISKWYTYDLQYWGLDYPPLTAYHSWLCGLIGSRINPSWFSLDASRGIESPESKVFMRATVLISDLLVYIPAVTMFCNIWHKDRSRRTQHIALLSLLFHPSLILIDSGHFQYNSVMLGLALHAMNLFALGYDFIGAICFVFSLGFKQMALYYAPAIGAYLLGKCLWLRPPFGLNHFTSLAFFTTGAFLTLFLPFLPPFSSLLSTSIFDPISRVFPFNRGLFEDKVANFWCASDVVFKWRNMRLLGRTGLLRLSTLFTAIGFAPAVYALLMTAWNRRQSLRDPPKTTSPPSTLSVSSAPTISSSNSTAHPPSPKIKSVEIAPPAVLPKQPCATLPLLPYALFTSSMSFFLFSFQVHEKSILLPLMPLTLLLSGSTSDSEVWEWGILVNNVSVFSMYPLLKKDGLGIQYVATTLLWNWLMGSPKRPKSLRHASLSFVQLLSLISYSTIILIHTLDLFTSPPARYPDLYTVLNVLISTSVFGLSWLWSIKRSMEVMWALGGFGSSKSSFAVGGTSGGSGHKKSAGSTIGGKGVIVKPPTSPRRSSSTISASASGSALGVNGRPSGLRANSRGDLIT
ncbi:ALG6, ALG8 glycosyltransferase [Sistotremastrum niveocremeum HHB9708]|uniref:Alpha-1,3-glucosyltransferase n=1 Tax=Sistotremastrum niveocremeum HHB9708 TaxID=1314777 RepID=A0A164TDB8_9AGAM|nr:ALG6, ALG8 glycosyltransferase [Sistotremastrum niveocremeum HHB9708]